MNSQNNSNAIPEFILVNPKLKDNPANLLGTVAKTKLNKSKIMNNDNLTGSLVLVHPAFEDDPLKKQGQIGILVYLRELHEMYVSFPRGGEGVYAWNNLLTLKDKQQVFDDLMKNGASMKPNDFKDMYKIMLLQDRGTNWSAIDALRIARDNPGIWDKTLEPVMQTEKLNLEKTHTR